jgi:hypothetical protein
MINSDGSLSPTHLEIISSVRQKVKVLQQSRESIQSAGQMLYIPEKW